MSYNAFNLAKWMDKENRLYLRIKTKSKEYNIIFDKSNLPHLLGLHYMYPSYERKTGIELLNIVLENELSDEDITVAVKKVHYQKDIQKNVQNRIGTLKEFLDLLDESMIVEKTTERTKIKSQYLAIKDIRGKFGQLGILNTGDKAYLIDYEFSKEVFETYIYNKKDYLYQGSFFEEPVEYVQRYDEREHQWKPFSFNETKQLKLENIEYDLDNEIYHELLEEAYFNEEASFLFDDFRFYPIKAFSEHEVENLLSNVAYDGLNHSFMSQKIKLDKLYPEEYKDFNEYFYKYVPKEYQYCELFYCKETRNLYLPTHNGLQKYIGYSEKKYLELLKEKFRDNRIEIGKEIKTKDGKGIILQKDNLKTLLFINKEFYYVTNLKFDNKKQYFDYDEKEVFKNLGLANEFPMGLQANIEILSRLKEENYINFTKSLVAIETNIQDEDLLEEIVYDYLNQDPEKISELINDFFVKEVNEKILPFNKKDIDL